MLRFFCTLDDLNALRFAATALSATTPERYPSVLDWSSPKLAVPFEKGRE